MWDVQFFLDVVIKRMTSNTPLDQTSESGVCHSADWCTIVNSSNKHQQRNNI